MVSIESIEVKEMNRKVLSLKKLSEGLLKDGAKEMTGRTRGVKVRGFLERILRGEGGPALVLLDFSGVGPIDFSWADEVVAKMISRLWSGEYGEKYLVLKGLNSSQLENISVALERKRLVVRGEGPSRKKEDSHRGRQFVYQSILS